MGLDDTILEFMKKLGLSDDEVRVYLAVLGAGRLALGDVSFLTGLPLDACKGVLDRLVELRFLRRVPGDVDGFVPLNPFLAGFLIVYEDLGNLLEGLREVLSSRVEDLSERLENSKSSSLDEISRLIRLRLDNLKSFVEEFTSLMGSRFEKCADSFRDLSVSVEETIHSLLSTGIVSMSDVERFEDVKSFSLSEITSEFISSVDEDTGSLEDLVSKTISAVIEEVHSRLELVKLRFSAALSDHRMRHEKSNSDLESRIGSVLDEDLNALKHSVEEIESSVLGMLRIVLEITDEKVEHFKTKYLETLNGLLNEYLDVLTSFEPRVKSIVDGLENVSSDLIRSTSVLASRRKAFASVVLKGDAFLEELNNQTKNLHEMAKSLGADFRSIISNQIVSAQEITDQISKSFTSFVDEKTSIVKDEVSRVEQKVKESLAQAPSRIKSRVFDTLSEIIRSDNEDCEKTCAQLEHEAGGYIDGAFKSVKDTLVSFESGTKDIFSTHKNNIRNRIKLLEYSVLHLRKKIAQMLQTNAFEYDQMIDELYHNLSTSVNQRVGVYINELDPFEERLASRISESYTESLDAVNRNVNDLLERTASILTQIEKKEEILRKIWEASYTLPIQDVKTWSLIGEEAIVAHIKSMVRRTKKNILIVSPELIPEILEELINVKRLKATVVSNIDLKVFESVIRHFSRQGNVKFLHYPNKDLWCVIRDNDEVLFAPVSAKEEMVAVVSEQYGYVRFNRELTAPMVLTKSKEIKIS
ncbi:MAG: hypothetical protein Q6352_017875 [Candidatus Freyrarchaeum guaymaensis]